MRVIDIMTSDVVTITPDAGLKDAARSMLVAGVSGLPVVDEGGVVVGIISEADFVEEEAARSWGRQRRRLLGSVVDQHQPRSPLLGGPVTVGDAMTARPIVIDQESDISEAARRMAEHGVKRLPVVTPDGRLLGIISRADIMMAYARPDEVIEEEIRSDIVDRLLMLEPDSVAVTVQDGAATLSGTVPRRTDARILEELVGRLGGITTVAADLTWEIDDIV